MIKNLLHVSLVNVGLAELDIFSKMDSSKVNSGCEIHEFTKILDGVEHEFKITVDFDNRRAYMIIKVHGRTFIDINTNGTTKTKCRIVSTDFGDRLFKATLGVNWQSKDLKFDIKVENNPVEIALERLLRLTRNIRQIPYSTKC